MTLLLEHLVRYGGGAALGAGRRAWTCAFSADNLPAHANGRVTETRYDPFGRLVSLTDPDGVAFTSSTGPASWTWAARVYDPELGMFLSPDPMFTGRDWISIDVGALPGVGTGQSVVELIIGRDPSPARRSTAASPRPASSRVWCRVAGRC